MTQEDEDDQEPIGNKSEDPHTAYLNALSEFNRKYELRNRSVGVAPPRRVPHGQASASQPAMAQPRKEVVQHKPIEKTFQRLPHLRIRNSPRKWFQKKRTCKRKK